jgi:hypothetical protein
VPRPLPASFPPLFSALHGGGGGWGHHRYTCFNCGYYTPTLLHISTWITISLHPCICICIPLFCFTLYLDNTLMLHSVPRYNSRETSLYLNTHLHVPLPGYPSPATFLHLDTHLLLYPTTWIPISCYIPLPGYPSPATSRYLDIHLLLHPSTWIHLSYYPLYLDTHLLLHPSTWIPNSCYIPLPGYASPTTSLYMDTHLLVNPVVPG